MNGDTAFWCVIILIIIGKILVLVYILVCCRNNRNRRNIAYQHTVIRTNGVTYPQPVLTGPFQQPQTNLPCNSFPQSHHYFQPSNRQHYNSTDDLPPTYLEAVNQNYITK